MKLSKKAEKELLIIRKRSKTMKKTWKERRKLEDANTKICNENLKEKNVKERNGTI